MSRKLLIPLLTFIFISFSPAETAEPLIQISVEVAEINNNKARELGIKWIDTIGTGEVAWDVSGRTPATLPEVPSIIAVGDWARYSALTAELKMLVTRGAAKIMSKPKLVTKSGSAAKFLVGGEIPIVASGVSGGTIEWKEYGVKMEIKPVYVVSSKTIYLSLDTEISRLDWANKVANYPAILTRNAKTELEVKSGETITIAGLVENTQEEQRSGIPLLMDIPILGGLFGRISLTNVENTVMIFVTPQLLQ